MIMQLCWHRRDTAVMHVCTIVRTVTGSGQWAGNIFRVDLFFDGAGSFSTQKLECHFSCSTINYMCTQSSVRIPCARMRPNEIPI